MTEHSPNWAMSSTVIDFFSTELMIETTSTTSELNTIQKMELNYLTSLINVEGSIKMFVALSYDKGLFNEIFARYTADLDIAEDEQEEALTDSAGDIINIIVGNTLADVNETDKKIIMSPPLVITAAQQIACQRNSLFYKANLITKYGALDVYLLK
ncbi:MAG: hypothetical protein CG439_268 [Methylococcaceae bacterium NSP1-2]|nr:chemotaxis protein CheX [Methylococcaceae bacterium]OYV20930.1 MAG: hypothetical protein CG439_268 [Methylococcaceae bacterium NSP1-2]